MRGIYLRVKYSYVRENGGTAVGGRSAGRRVDERSKYRERDKE